MLRFFRGGGVAQVLVGGIVFAIILVFVFEFRSGRGPTAGLKRQCTVEYAGECVDPKTYFAAYGLVAPRGVEAKAARRLGLRRKVLEGLVERELLASQAEKLGLAVGEDAIDAELEAGRAHVSLPAADVLELSPRLGLCRLDRSGRGCEPNTDLMVRQLRVRRTPNDPFDYKLYEREIRSVANRGPREFREMQARELLADRLRKLVRSRVRVSDQEAEFVAQRAVIRSAQLSRDWFAKYAVDTSDAALERWAFENRSQIDAAWESEKVNWSAGCPLIREVVVPLPTMALDEEKDPLKKQAEAARERLGKGEDFGLVARQVSTSRSAVMGGRVGCLSKAYGIGSDELLKAVASLKPGELSPVLETPTGYHVVQLIGPLEAAQVEVEGKRHIALNLFVRFAADEAARRFADQLIAAVKAGEKLEDAVRRLSEAAIAAVPAAKSAAAKSAAAKEAGTEPPALQAADRPRFEVSEAFGRSGNPLPNLEPKEPIASRAFELGKADSVYEKPVETATGWVVFQLKELTQPEDFAKEKAEVLQALWQMKASDALTRYVADLRRTAGTKLKIDTSFGEDNVRANDE